MNTMVLNIKTEIESFRRGTFCLYGLLYAVKFSKSYGLCSQCPTNGEANTAKSLRRASEEIRVSCDNLDTVFYFL